MNPISNQRFKIGLFVFVALILLAAMLTLFGGFPDLFRRYEMHTIRFKDASGIIVGTPVQRSGIRIGEVKRIELDDATDDVIVHIAIDKKYKIYNEDQPALRGNGFLGGNTSIDFIPRSQLPPPLEPIQRPSVQPLEKPATKPDPPPPDPVPGASLPSPPPTEFPVIHGEEASQPRLEDRTPAKPGTEFKGIRDPDVGNVIKAMAELVEPTQESLRLIRQSLQRLEKTAPMAEDSLKEFRDLARESRLSIPDLRRTNDEINVTARNWGKLGERLDVLLQTNQEKLVKSLDNLNDVLTRTASILSDENQRNLNAALKNIKAGTDNLESITKNTDELMKESRATVKRLNDSLVKADEVMTNLQQATKPLAERGDSIAKNLDEGAVKLNRTLSDVRELMRVLGEGDGTVQKLLSDPGLYNHLDEVTCAVKAMMPRVDRMLRDLEVFADKLARHPESIGLGGAIRPSAGLKEAPSAPSPSPLWPRR